MTKPLLRGVLKTWKEDRGFGFITPETGGKDIFIHISAIGSESGRRPEPGDVIQYQVARDKHGKFRAVNAHIESIKYAKKKAGAVAGSTKFIPIVLGILLVVLAAAAIYFFRYA